MYDDRQHLELFANPCPFLFRGTLASEDFQKPYQGPGITPTSVDPVVATLFACRYRMDGPAIVLVGLKEDFKELLDGPNLASFNYEMAVNLEMPPFEFEPRCAYRVPLEIALRFLDQMGYSLPSRLPDLGALTQALV